MTIIEYAEKIGALKYLNNEMIKKLEVYQKAKDDDDENSYVVILGLRGGRTFLSTLIAKYEAYMQGRADYEAECEKIFAENPPMHFTTEQKMWLKQFISKRYQQGRIETIEEFRKYLKTVGPCNMPQELWNIGVDNTCDRMMKGQKE